MNLKGRSLLTLKDYSKEEIEYLIDLADALKLKKKKKVAMAGLAGKLLDGKNVVLLFEKTSTRTRCSFEVAIREEGGGVTFLTNSQMGKKESLEDSAKIFGRMFDAIEFRGYEHKTLMDLYKYSGIPVINGLTDEGHPIQVLADFMAAREHLKKPLNKIKLAFIGDGRNNVSNELMIGASRVGMDYAVASPESLFPSKELVDQCKKWAEENGSEIVLTADPYEAVKGADIIYTDIWFSMGEEDLMEERIKLLKPYQVNMDLIKATGKEDTIFEHCLPSFHDLNTEVGKYVYEKFGLKEMEVTDEVFRSKNSIVFDEAEDRVHTTKAVVCALISDSLEF